MPTTLTYVSNTTDDHFETRLIIHSDGTGVLKIGSNQERRDAAVGLFQATVPPPLLGPLAAAIRRPAFTHCATQATLIPDETFREISINDDGADIRKLIGEQLAAPDPFTAVEKEIQPIIEYLRGHPIYAMAMAVRVRSERLVPGGRVAVDIVLRNVGRQPFQLDTPVHWGANQVHCEAVALRSDIPLAALRTEHQYFVQIGAANFVKSAPTFDTSLAVLKPAEQLAAHFQDRLDWASGQYQVTVRLAATLLSGDGQPVFSGGLVGQPQSLDVAGPNP